MLVYYYATVDESFDLVEAVLMGLSFAELAEVAYRDGERLVASMGVGGGAVAKKVELEVGDPVQNPDQTIVPVRWSASGASVFFPQMEADLVLTSMGENSCHLALQGSYRPPLGKVGELLNRAVLHRVAEASVKSFVDRLASGLKQAISDAEAG